MGKNDKNCPRVGLYRFLIWLNSTYQFFSSKNEYINLQFSTKPTNISSRYFTRYFINNEQVLKNSLLIRIASFIQQFIRIFGRIPDIKKKPDIRPAVIHGFSPFPAGIDFRCSAVYSLVHTKIMLQTGVYKVPYNLIFFPTPIFKILIFFKKISVFRLFPSWYSSQQPQYYRKDDIASTFPFFHVIFFPTAMTFSSVFIT